MKFTYQAETFSKARRHLMLPHPHGEAASITHAFSECKIGLLNFNEQDLDDNAKDWLAKLRKQMDMTDITSLSVEQKVGLSHIIDSLANWFTSQAYSKTP